MQIYCRNAYMFHSINHQYLLTAVLTTFCDATESTVGVFLSAVTAAPADTGVRPSSTDSTKQVSFTHAYT